MTYPLVKVVWIDTVETSDSSWQQLEELLKETPASIDSVGYMIKQNEDYIVIAADKATKDDDDLFGRCQVIPKGVVKTMIEI
jgi:hypothetical protein|tara:strand:+ start:559 stop:804 length:246 start_codon:yes stop_codon:yes gene_type:complete